ncbi:MAG: diguanylate cyclase [Bdellovibrio sp.]|nr:MAG: diguanylate cyclase [Bdellovibrio sp.]
MKRSAKVLLRGRVVKSPSREENFCLQNSSEFLFFSLWCQQIFKKGRVEEAVESFMNEVLRRLPEKSEIIYFKSVHPKGQMAFSSATSFQWKSSLVGLTLPFEQEDPKRAEQEFEKMRASVSWKSFVQKLKGRQVFLLPFVFNSKIQGVFVILQDVGLHPPVAEGRFSDLVLQTYFFLLQQACEKIALQSRIHHLLTKDEETGFWMASQLFNRLSAEISRSRRLSKPVSLAHMYFKVAPKCSRKEEKVLFRFLAYLLKENSRINDLFFKVSYREIVLVMPHTDKNSAAIKCERLRRIIEHLSFEKILPEGNDIKVQVAIGLSEYPSLCQGAESLINSAADALKTLKQKNVNRVCLASVSKGFQPDFQPF